MTRRTTLEGAQSDRAAGVLLATACGDALGAGYEFGPPLADDVAVDMVGGGRFGWAPGEWTDDTAMAVAIAEAAASGADLRAHAAQDALVARWAGWAREAADIGIQTRTVLNAAGRHPTASALAAAASAHHQRTGRSGGNGSLMRTAPLALAFLHDPDGLIEAARAVSALTHHDPQAGEACVLWCLAIRHAVLHGRLDGLREGLDRLPADRAAVWAARLDEAESHPPAFFDRNGWVVQALQGAWSAISRTPIPSDDPGRGMFPAQHLQLAWRRLSVAGGTPTPSPPSPAGCSAPAGGFPPSRWSGRAGCTAGLGTGPGTLSASACSPPAAGTRTARAGPASPCSTTPVSRDPPPSPSIPTTRACGSAGCRRCTSCPTGWTRWCRCAGSAPMRPRPPVSPPPSMSRSG